MRCGAETIAFDEERDRQIVEYILFELVSGVLCQDLKEPGLFR